MNTESARAYLELTKPRIVSMVLITTTVGYLLGAKGEGSIFGFVATLLGTACTCGGAGVLNQFLERDADALMHRTRNRPIPAGTIQPANALVFGIILVLGGTAFLVSYVNLLTGFLALLTAFLYVLVYTPLKRTTWLNTFIGAIPGALPPVGGWAGAADSLGIEAWILFAILFAWQHPHFYAIAWMCKEDYARGGFKMLPVIEPDGRSTFRQILVYSVLLLVVSLTPMLVGMSGIVYTIGALIAGLALLRVGITLAGSHTVNDARRLLRASVIYLPIVLTLIFVDGKF